jgi:hypothetical protein
LTLARTRLITLLCALAAAVAAPSASAGSGLMIGAADDSIKDENPLAVQARMGLAHLAGFDTVRIGAYWKPGHTAPTAWEVTRFQNAVDAATLNSIRVIVVVANPGSRTTPRTARLRGQFARYAAAIATSVPAVKDFIVGSEPNLNHFWMPQFTKKGGDAAAPAYESLLARTYDALKAVSPDINVIGGAVSPRGEDKAHSIRPTHSPTTFIPDLGRAYRRSKRTKPIMDMFDFHPYLRSSRLSPLTRHPGTTTVSIADYDKLVALLGKAFDGTAQRGSSIPIVYSEFGIQSKIPSGKKGDYHHATKRALADAVPESKQARFYRQALSLAYCQPTVVGFLIFRLIDEPDLRLWQSGLFYADDTPKSSLPSMRQSVEQVRAGQISCSSAGPSATPRTPNHPSARGSGRHLGAGKPVPHKGNVKPKPHKQRRR